MKGCFLHAWTVATLLAGSVVCGAPRSTQGPARSGLAVRVMWFEVAEGQEKGTVHRFELAAGCAYPSQRVRQVLPLRPGGKRDKDDDGNTFIKHEEPIPVTAAQPVPLGFIANVDLYTETYMTVSAGRTGWQHRVPASIREAYLADSYEYSLSAPQVQERTKILVEHRPAPLELVRRVWGFVNGHVTYGMPRRPNTAAQVLDWGTGRCSEHTRLAVALLRAGQLPARQVHALAVSPKGPAPNNHSWAETYLAGAGWVPVDTRGEPPEGNRYRLDYNHYLVVCRTPDRFDTDERYRVVRLENVSPPADEAFWGYGLFARVPPRDRQPAIRLLQTIAADDGGRRAGRLLASVERLHRSAQPIHYWLLAASADEPVAMQGARSLVNLCTASGSELELERFIKASPRLVAERIQRAEKGG